MKLFLVLWIGLALCLLSPVAARRPGPLLRRRGIMPTPEELQPLPQGFIVVPPPERSSVDPVPISTLLAPVEVPQQQPVVPVPEVPEVQTGGPEPGLVPGPDSQPGTKVVTSTVCTQTNILPLRTQWSFGNGYCGEMSLQHIAMTRGIWISQQIARDMGVIKSGGQCQNGNPGDPGYHDHFHQDLLFESRLPTTNGAISGIYGVAKALGLYQPSSSYWYADNQTRSASKTLTPSPSAFALWIKQNVIAGRPVIAGFRLKYGTYEDYDHIMPVYGMCYSSVSSLATTDRFTFTDNYGSTITHTPGDTSFYANYGACTYTGCIPKDYWDMGLAVGPLDVPLGVYFPVKITLTSRWSDRTAKSGEPSNANNAAIATASYSLTVTGLTANTRYILYRTTGTFAGGIIPQSAAALADVCTAQGTGCTTHQFTATSSSRTITQAQAGNFVARSITYFLVVRAP